MGTKVEIVEGRIISPYEEAHITGQFELVPWKKKRSLGQNAFIHKILFPMLAEGMTAKTGKTITPELAKAVVKHKFLQRFTDLGTIEMPTSKLNTKECVEFIEKCQQYAADMLDISIPSPNETPYNFIDN